VKSIAISRFKATCLAVLEQVRHTGEPVVVTKRGEPIAEIVPPSLSNTWLGSARQRGRITGDIVSPVVAEDAWEAHGG
jgi:prevent-host-death family protein